MKNNGGFLSCGGDRNIQSATSVRSDKWTKVTRWIARHEGRGVLNEVKIFGHRSRSRIAEFGLHGELMPFFQRGPDRV